MLKNAEVIKLFVCGNPCYNGSLHVTNVRGIYRLYSYATCICEIDPHRKKMCFEHYEIQPHDEQAPESIIRCATG